MIKYITHKDGNIVGAYEMIDTQVTVNYPGYKTDYVQVDDDLWKDIKLSPEKYIYKNGKVVLLA